MALISRRAARGCAALLLSSALLLGGSACGFNAQTLQPYTPAEGVNIDTGSGQGVIKIRNVMILSRADGQGFLSASIVSNSRDALISVAGTAVKADGTDGSALTATLADPVAVGNGILVVLTDRAPTTIKGADLKAGLEAKLVLEFSNAGQVFVTVPVVNANQPDYATVTPAASATPSS